MTASAGNVLDNVLGVGEEKYERCCGDRLRRQRARHCAESRGGEVREALQWPSPP